MYGVSFGLYMNSNLLISSSDTKGNMNSTIHLRMWKDNLIGKSFKNLRSLEQSKKLFKLCQRKLTDKDETLI
jgi:hypothetical protein